MKNYFCIVYVETAKNTTFIYYSESQITVAE